MLTLGIRYITGSVAASDVAVRDQVEWPPHPGRVFMALAAAHFETGEIPAERAALEWFETLPAPQVTADEHMPRTAVTHFVPVNDRAGPKGSPLSTAPGAVRVRQERTFARAWLANDTVYLHWPDISAAEHQAALEALAAKVTRIGHSVSLVQCWFTNSAPETLPNWMPDAHANELRLRITGPGVLRELERRYAKPAVQRFFELREAAADGVDKKRQKVAKAALKTEFADTAPLRLRPELSLSHGYALRTIDPIGGAVTTVFDSRLIVFTLYGAGNSFRFLDLTATLQVTERLREALFSHLGADGEGPIPEVLSGHGTAGPSQVPHLACLSLPFVGHEHAHGGLLGVAFALPRIASTDQRRRVLRAAGALRNPAEGLRLGRLGRWKLTAPDSSSPQTVRDRSWTAAPNGAIVWSTVTPYVFDRHAKAKNKAAYLDEVAAAVRYSWSRVENIGPTGQQQAALVDVVVTPISRHLGTPAANDFPRLRRKDGSLCRHVHLVLTFDRPVVGPLLLGAGRYFGYGLCRPVRMADVLAS